MRSKEKTNKKKSLPQKEDRKRDLSRTENSRKQQGGSGAARAPGCLAQKLSLSIGDFIRYWGFRRIHGAIWAQLYLSKSPLSCTDLTRKLDLSKALISPALDELCQYKLIAEAPAPNDKVKVYQANADINSVIKHVLEVREQKMLQEITQDFSNFDKEESKGESYDPQRVRKLEEMIFAANLMLQMMLAQDDLMQLPMDLEH